MRYKCIYWEILLRDFDVLTHCRNQEITGASQSLAITFLVETIASNLSINSLGFQYNVSKNEGTYEACDVARHGRHR